VSDIVAGMTQISASGFKGENSTKKDTPEGIAKAASQFEALLIGQLLQSARAGDDQGWFGTDESDAGSTLTEMSEQVLSSTLAAKGGLGLAKLVTKGMEKSSEHVHQIKQEG
jgi:Rod binding domain-containing protein